MSEEKYGWDRYEGFISDSILKQFGIEQKDVDKVKEILDMIETKENEIVISVGSNIQIKIKK